MMNALRDPRLKWHFLAWVFSSCFLGWVFQGLLGMDKWPALGAASVASLFPMYLEWETRNDKERHRE